MQRYPQNSFPSLEQPKKPGRAGASSNGSTMYFIVLGFLTGLGVFAIRNAILFFS